MTQKDSNTFNVSDINRESGEPTGEMTTVNGVETNLPELQDNDHPLIPDFNHTYVMREIEGTTDLELVSFTLEDKDFCTLIIGEAGTGKDASYEVLASEGNWPMIRFSLGSGMTYDQLIGRYVPADGSERDENIVEREEAVERTKQRLVSTRGLTDEEAREEAKQLLPEESLFTFQYGMLAQAVKYGWLVVADELNAMDEEQSLALNQVAEDRESRQLTILETSEVIDPHPRFRFGATMNPPDYAGTTPLNAALKSRFYPIEFDYLPADAEKAILQERTNIIKNSSEAAVDSLIQLVNDIRQQEQQGNDVMTKINTRSLLKIGNLTEIMNIKEATRTVLIGVADEVDEQPIREMIKTQKFR